MVLRHQETIRRTESKIRSAPRSPTRLRGFMREKAQSLSEVKCIVSARQSLGGIATTMTQIPGTAWTQACHSGVTPIA
jgi:hypothetical protein